MVRNLASRESIQVFDGRVKDQAFHELFKHTWRPDLCIMATFGQLIDMPLFPIPLKASIISIPMTERNGHQNTPEPTLLRP